MTISSRELWTSFHGMVLGVGFLLAFSGSAASLWGLRAEWMTPAGIKSRARWLIFGSWLMAILAWVTVFIGTFVVYPWYRAAPPKDVSPSALSAFPKAVLLSNPQTVEWHEFGMEWKEHVGWVAPIFATAVALIATCHRKVIADQAHIRRAMLVLLTAAFFAASVAGFFGAFINKLAPLR